MAIPPRRDPRPLLLLFSLIAMVMLSMPLAAAPPDLPVISIGLDDYGNVPVGRLIRAQADVAQVYCDVGVEIAWRETRHLSAVTPPARTRLTPSSPGLTIIILSPEMVTRMAPPAAALGIATGSVDGPGHIAYVFYSRLPILNPGNDDEIMGLVIAHEIGHLLLPHGSHSDTGIMRGQWDFRELRRVSLHALAFTPFQAQEIRRRASVAAVSGHVITLSGIPEQGAVARGGRGGR